MRRRATLSLLCLLMITGCAREESSLPAASSQPAGAEHDLSKILAEGDAVAAMKSGDVFVHADGVRSVRSNDGEFRIAYFCAASASAGSPAMLPLTNEHFFVNVIVFPRRRPDAHVSLNVDAAMPEHGHGMNVEPTIVELYPGRFRVENMLFHMPGRWEIYFDVTRDGITSRAQDEMNLQ